MKESVKKKFDSIDQSKIKVESTKEILAKIKSGLNSKDEANQKKAETLLDTFISKAKAKNADIFKEEKPEKPQTAKEKKETKSKLDEVMDIISKDPMFKDFNSPRRIKGGGKSDALIDSQRKAKESGFRISKKGWKNQYGASDGGRKYYEYRENRIDRKAPNYGSKPWLKDGGFIHPSDKFENKFSVIEIKDNGDRKVHNTFPDFETAMAFASLKRNVMPSQTKIIVENKDGVRMYSSFRKGGKIDESTEMLLSQNKEIGHHTKELKNALSKKPHIEPWVVAKIERAATDMSDVTHYLDGQTEYAKGGYMAKGGITKDSIKRTLTSDTSQYFLEKDGDGYILTITPRGAMNSNFYYKFNVESLPNDNTRLKYRLSPLGYVKSGYMAKGGIVVTSIKDIPNFEERLNQGRITYRGLGVGKLSNDFYNIAGEGGKMIKVDGKEYYITDTEFNSFSRDADGMLRVKFAAPKRKFERGGYMARGGQVEFLYSDSNFDNKYYKRFNGAIGSFAWIYEKRYNEGILYPLDAFDLDYYAHLPLKENEVILRYQSDRMRDVDSSMYLIKFNVKKMLVYFMEDAYSDDDKNIKFSPKGLKLEYLTIEWQGLSSKQQENINLDKFKNGGDVSTWDRAVYKYLEGKSIFVYSMGVKTPINVKITGVVPPDPKFSIPTLKLETGNTEERIEGKSKIQDFMNGEQIELYDGKEYYAIQLASNIKSSPKSSDYTKRRNLKLIVIKNPNKNGSKNYLIIDKRDFLNGLHKFEEGGNLSKEYTYIKRADVNEVVYRDSSGKEIIDSKPKNGFWVSKKALVEAGMNKTKSSVKFEVDDLVYNTRTKTLGIVRMADDGYGEVKTDADGNVNVDDLEIYNPIKHKYQENAEVAPSTKKEIESRGLFNPFAKSKSNVSSINFGTTSMRKTSSGWIAKNKVSNYKGYDWEITTMKSMRGDLVSTAVGGKNEKSESGYTMFTYVMYQDPNIRLMTSRPSRITEKVTLEQQEKALTIFQDKVNEKYDKGGKIGFEGLSNKVAKNYEGKKVAPKYRKKYGETYDKQEAKEVGDKVAAKVYRQQLSKMEDGGALPEKMENYFIKTRKTKLLKMSDLLPNRARPEGIVNAEKYMRLAAEGKKEKRKPITVYHSARNYYRIYDGNSTYAVAKQNGWENIWAEVIKNPNRPKTGKPNNQVFMKAKEIRKDGENWTDAVKRAAKMLKN